MKQHISDWDAYQYNLKVVGKREHVGVFFAESMEMAQCHLERNILSELTPNEIQSISVKRMTEEEFDQYKGVR